MPIGSWSAFTKVMQCVLATSPKSVLDLGIGHGINGAGIRNWLDVGVTPYKTILDGVEGFEKYESPLWNCYNNVTVGDIVDYLHYLMEEGGSYDTIIMTDVIEHFTKEEGARVAELMKFLCNKSAIISTPAVWIEQGAVYGNEMEVHRSLWDAIDFSELGYGIVMDGRLDQYGHKMIVAEYIKR